MRANTNMRFILTVLGFSIFFSGLSMCQPRTAEGQWFRKMRDRIKDANARVPRGTSQRTRETREAQAIARNSPRPRSNNPSQPMVNQTGQRAARVNSPRAGTPLSLDDPSQFPKALVQLNRQAANAAQSKPPHRKQQNPQSAAARANPPPIAATPQYALAPSQQYAPAPSRATGNQYGAAPARTYAAAPSNVIHAGALGNSRAAPPPSVNVYQDVPLRRRSSTQALGRAGQRTGYQLPPQPRQKNPPYSNIGLPVGSPAAPATPNRSRNAGVAVADPRNQANSQRGQSHRRPPPPPPIAYGETSLIDNNR